uniref:Uncharacterized protein n=1 Tax=Oreochromis niloticus TaxID=8128 RepID=A0A669BL90_ORENI
YLRHSRFPDKALKAKHHYLLHYAELILHFGPLIRLCTLRFESKHSYFKACTSSVLHNFVNLCKTERHQLLQSYLSAFLLSPYTIQFPLNCFSGMEIEEELTSLLPTLDREKIICIVEHLTDVIGVQQKSDLLFVEAEDLKPFLTPIQIRKLLLAFKGGLCRFSETSSHPPHPSSSTSWVSHLQIPWERFPLRLSHAITRGDRAHPDDRRSMVRIVVEAMQVHCRNPKRASCEEVAKIIVNRYPQTFADFTETGERLGCGHYSLLRSIKSRVEHVNRDNTTHRLRQTKRTRNEEDCSPNSNATSPKKVRCLVDSYGCINWQPVELPEGEMPASLEEKKHILLTIFNSEGPGAVERPDVDDFMCLTYISQRQLINSCPSLSVAEIQEQWPFLFTRKGLSNHFYKLTGIDISERLGQALITKGRRIINYFSNVSFFHTETSTRMSLEAESNLPIAPRLIMLGQSSMTATCWMVNAEGRVIVELDKENTFADAMSVFFGSFYVLNLEYQESACATLELIQRFFVRINPEEGTKCTSKVGTSRKTGTTVKRKVVHINPHVTTFLQRLTEFENFKLGNCFCHF